MKKTMKRIGALLLSGVLAVGILTGCTNDDSGNKGKDNSFEWWIPKDDSEGTYYNGYEENVAVQWLTAQYWDTENHALGDKDNGRQVDLSFIVPISGSEQDNYNTMLSTGSYPEILDLQYAKETPKSLCENGVLMELTEYIEKYMPNYVELLEANPDLKNMCTVTDEDGKVHYYAIYKISDGASEPWEGFSYRRDWVVDYAEPTEYVWDWESDAVKENGHPEVTPLAEAVKQNNLNGWKKNPVTEFTYSEGNNPSDDYEDNVIFPSGLTKPYTISDWEWMMEAFEKAIEAEGFSDNSSAYCITIPYQGCFLTGDLISSFGEEGAAWSMTSTGETVFGGTSDTFKTYLTCVNTWYNNGWVDKAFETRTSDMFFQVNINGFSQGMVGMQCTGASFLGSQIRTTCTSEQGKNRAMVMGCQLPINDVYGTDENKFIEPTVFYQGSRVTGKVALTTKAEGKDLEALFTMFNYMSSAEGCRVSAWGLNEEQLASMEFEPNLYEEMGIDSAYTIEKQEDGRDLITLAIDLSDSRSNAIRCSRIGVGRGKSFETEEYIVASNRDKWVQDAISNWSAYVATGYIADFDQLMTDEESELKAKTFQTMSDVMAVELPILVKNGLDGWDAFVEKIEACNPDAVTEIYNQYTKK